MEPYGEEMVIARIKEMAPEMLEIHLNHLKEHAQELPEHHTHKMPEGVTTCPSAQMLHWPEKREMSEETVKIHSELQQWPIQLHLVPPIAPYYRGADLVIVADCVPFACANFHQDFLGVTGDWAEVKRLVEGVDGFVRLEKKRPDDDAYLVRHSANVLVIGPKGRSRASINPPLEQLSPNPSKLDWILYLRLCS